MVACLPDGGRSDSAPRHGSSLGRRPVWCTAARARPHRRPPLAAPDQVSSRQASSRTCWSAPATSPTADRRATKPRPVCSTASPAPCSRPATTPTRRQRVGVPGLLDPTWGRHRERTYPTPGNHDYDSNDGARGYFDYFGDRAGPRSARATTPTMSATWRVYALNSEIERVPGLAQSQMDWLRGELSSRPAPCSIAVWHKPLFTSGPNGENPHMRDIFRLLYDNGVDIVLNGHDHLYERFAPQDPTAGPIRRAASGSSRSGRAASPPTPNPRVAPNSERILTVVGRAQAHAAPQFVRLGVHPGRSGRFATADSGSCH